MKIFKMPQRKEEKPDITEEIDLLRDIKILITYKVRKVENLRKFKIVFQSLGDAKVSLKL